MTTPPTGSIEKQVRDLLTSVEPVERRTDDALLASIVTLERIANSAYAMQAEAMAEMSRRALRADEHDAQQSLCAAMPPNRRSEFVADEIAVALRCTKMVAATRYGLALAASSQPSVIDAWADGDIDARKTQVICDGLRDVSTPAREALAEQASVFAGEHTAPEVRRWLSRRVIAADPGMAEVRRARAVEARRVMVTPLPDGISELTALLPSIQARRVYDTVNSLARAAGSDDVRTMDQRRADALFDLLCGRAAPPQVNVAVTVPADVLLGKSAEPGEVCGVGSVTSSEVLRLTGLVTGDPPPSDVTLRRLLVDPETGTLTDLSEDRYRPSAKLARAVCARDGVCRFPGCSRSAATSGSGTDLDHTVPWPRGETSASNLAVLCRHHHRLKHSPGWEAELDPDGVMRWTTPSGESVVTYPWAYAEPAITDSG